MKRYLAALIMVSAWLTLAAPVMAEYGVWEEVSPGLNPPGLSNSAYMDIAVGDADNLYTVGMQQTGALEITWAWKSMDAGAYWNGIYGYDMSGMTNECYAWKLVATFYLGVDSTGPDNTIMAGMAISDECLDAYEFPACMFICMLQLGAAIAYSDDGGSTVQQAEIEGGMMKILTYVDMVDTQLGYAIGAPKYIIRTQDGGHSWFPINAPGDSEIGYNDLQFFSADEGYVISGEYPEEVDDDTWAEDEKTEAPDLLPPLYQATLEKTNYMHNPMYRMDYQSKYEKKDGFNGQLFRTTDGALSWEAMYQDPDAAFYQIRMINEQEGWMLVDPRVYTTHPYGLLHTVDGGYTWEDVTSRVPATIPGVAAYAISAMTFSPNGQVGFLGGGAQTALGMYRAVMIHTADGGETWEIDENVLPWGHPVLAFNWYNDKLAWAAAFDRAVFRYTQQNVAPVADAGPDQTVPVETLVTLDGSGSFDSDGDTLTYAWAQTGGPEAGLSDEGAVQPTFTAATVGELIFELTVSDGTESDTDSVTITVTSTGDDDTADDDTADDDAGDDDATDDDAADDDAVDDDDDNDDNGDDDDDDSSACGC